MWQLVLSLHVWSEVSSGSCRTKFVYLLWALNYVHCFLHSREEDLKLSWLIGLVTAKPFFYSGDNIAQERRKSQSRWQKAIIHESHCAHICKHLSAPWFWLSENVNIWMANHDLLALIFVCRQSDTSQPIGEGVAKGQVPALWKWNTGFMLVSVASFLLLTPLNSTSLICKNQEALANEKWRTWHYCNSKGSTGIAWLITYLLKSYCLFYCRSVNKNQSWDVNLSLAV